MRKPIHSLPLIVIFILLATAGRAQVVDTNAKWTWKAGNVNALQLPAYGTKGVPGAATAVFPGSRTENFTWTDSSGRLYTFGGFYNLQNTFCDIWRYHPDSNTWTWIHGASGYTTQTPSINREAVVASAATVFHVDNMPGCRADGAKWVDSARNLWIFGGHRVQNGIRRNDLWKYETTTNRWAWMNGSTAAVNTAGNYGTKGVASTSNQPGSRGYGNPAAWIDHKAQKLYMFGGTGHDRNNTMGNLDDLWVYDMRTNQWTWIGGSDLVVTTTANTQYGTLGVEASSNWPLARQNMAYWQDNTGMFWMYGGSTTVSGVAYYLNDLWRYNPVSGMWAWMGGDATLVTNGHPNVSGVRGLAAASNKPGGRTQILTWVDVNGKLWMYGGYGVGQNGTLGRLNDMWQFDPVTRVWTWMLGDNDPGTANGRMGTYATVGAAGVPGARRQTDTWLDKDGNFWFLAGEGTANATAAGFRSDMWKLEGTAPPIPPQPGLFIVASPNVCAGAQGVVYTIPPVSTATSYEWEYTGSNVNFSPTTTAATNTLDFAANATGGTLRVRGVAGGGRGPWRDTVITVHQPPVVNSTNTGLREICAGDSIMLSASGSTGVSYEWFQGTVAVATGSNYYANSAGTYTVKATNNTTGCQTTSTPPTTLVVHPRPLATISASGPTELCTGASVTLSVPTLVGADYQWTRDGSPIGTNSPSFTATFAGKYKALVTYTATGCAETSSEVEVIMHVRPSANLVPLDTAICSGEIVKMEVRSQDTALTYLWTLNGNTIPLASAYFLEVMDPGVYKVEVGRKWMAGCDTFTNEATVTVFPLPNVSITWDGQQLEATPGYVTYQWLVSGQPIPGATGQTYKPGTYGAYRVRVTDTNSCSNLSQVMDIILGLEDIELLASLIQVYPNPVNDYLNVMSPVDTRLVLMSMDGKVILQTERTQQLYLGNIASGVYLLKISDMDGNLLRHEKVIKQ